MALHKSSMLVKLEISQWDGFKKDNRAAETVDQQFHTVGGVGNYNKRLLNKVSMAPVQSLVSKIRATHARFTMPWCYDGLALLPSKFFLEYTEAMRQLKDQFDAAVDNLITQYPIYKSDQAQALGNLYDSGDYPTSDELRRRFKISHRFFPVPQSDHFVVDLAAEDEAKLRHQLAQELQATQDQALKSLYDRISELASRIYDRLSDPKNVFRDSMIEAVTQLVAVLPALNIFKDPLLDELTADMRNKLMGHDPDQLRTDLALRAQVAQDAYDILIKLKGNTAAPEPQYLLAA